MISKSRFESIALDEAQKVAPDGWLCGSDPVLEFAHALLKAVEDESKVVGQGLFDTEGKCYAIGQHRSPMCVGGKAFKSVPLIALPIVEGVEK